MARSSARTPSPRVTVSIVNFNGASLTLRTLARVLAQDGAGACEVVVVDNGSADLDVVQLAAGVGPDVRLLRLPTNRGYAAACNAVARIAVDLGSTFVWFLNNDVDMGENLLATLCASLDGNPSVAAVAPVTVDARDGQTVLGAGASITLWRGKVGHLHAGRPIASLPRAPFEVDAIEGAGPLVRTAALLDVGGWDEGFFMYWEDTEWSARARRTGSRLLVDPNALLQHAVSASSPPITREEMMMRNRMRFVRIAAPAWAQPVFFLYFTVLWLPAYYVTRLAPRYGVGRSASMAIRSVLWNVRDAVAHRRWMLRRSDQQIPSLD